VTFVPLRARAVAVWTMVLGLTCDCLRAGALTL